MTVDAEGITLIGIVVPVLNEAALLPRALDAIAAARQEFERESMCRVRLVIVDDGSTDDSARIARSRPDVEVIASRHRGVGSARAAGAAHLLAGARPTQTWIASTDGDSAVPAEWLSVHHAAATSGAEVLVGQIEPDPADLTPRQLRRWRSLNPPTTEPVYIHGANLGIRGDVYLRSGGFQAASSDEDVLLVDALRHQGSRIRGTDQAPVLTSGRVRGRAPDGFARYVREELG
ncbi:glycosyltransferase [Naasia lichenicola]|uniref:4,4'-diaponeurosporenoate glycosyltransferase n=1 Tax=Naasia lichenicola TaxID=2565933 RepID=A0A4S4FIE9_9MICO|nr:glycosyltransferase [Naasia lichenicola]THG30029.1 glycosyltransferase [Naasia lichenicola]